MSITTIIQHFLNVLNIMICRTKLFSRDCIHLYEINLEDFEKTKSHISLQNCKMDYHSLNNSPNLFWNPLFWAGRTLQILSQSDRSICCVFLPYSKRIPVSSNELESNQEFLNNRRLLTQSQWMCMI